VNTNIVAESPDVQSATFEIDPSQEADYQERLDYDRACDAGEVSP
jgi:hypothetical protein